MFIKFCKCDPYNNLRYFYTNFRLALHNFGKVYKKNKTVAITFIQVQFVVTFVSRNNLHIRRTISAQIRHPCARINRQSTDPISCNSSSAKKKSLHPLTRQHNQVAIKLFTRARAVVWSLNKISNLCHTRFFVICEFNSFFLCVLSLISCLTGVQLPS